MIVRRYADKRLKYLVVNKRVPTKLTLKVMKSRRWGLHILEMPTRDSRLSWLDANKESIESLLVTDMGDHSPTFIEECIKLTRLSVNFQPNRYARISHLNLVSFTARGVKEWRDICRIASLKDLYLEHGDFSWVESSDFSLEKLTLTNMRGKHVVPNSDALRKLSTLVIDGPKELDLSALHDMKNLKEVYISSVQKITGLSLDTCRRLNKVVFENVRELDNANLLSDVLRKKTLLIKPTPFTADEEKRLGT